MSIKTFKAKHLLFFFIFLSLLIHFSVGATIHFWPSDEEVTNEEEKDEKKKKQREISGIIKGPINVDLLLPGDQSNPDPSGNEESGDKGEKQEKKEASDYDISDKGELFLFPDAERISKLAAAEKNKPSESYSLSKNNNLKLSIPMSDNPIIGKYRLALLSSISKNLWYPSASVLKGEQGKLIIDFIIPRDGKTDNSDIRLLKSSGYPALDDAALTAIRLATPFNALPEEYDEDKLGMHITFEFVCHNCAAAGYP